MTIAVLIHAVAFLLFWLTNLSFQKDVNNFLSGAIGLKMSFLLIFILFSLIVGVWSSIRMAFKSSRKLERGFFFGIGGFYLVFFYGTFIILFIKNPVQLPRLGQLNQYFRIFFDTVILFVRRMDFACEGQSYWLAKMDFACSSAHPLAHPDFLDSRQCLPQSR